VDCAFVPSYLRKLINKTRTPRLDLTQSGVAVYCATILPRGYRTGRCPFNENRFMEGLIIRAVLSDAQLRCDRRRLPGSPFAPEEEAAWLASFLCTCGHDTAHSVHLLTALELSCTARAFVFGVVARRLPRISWWRPTRDLQPP
jgi:hypothetical protein